MASASLTDLVWSDKVACHFLRPTALFDVELEKRFHVLRVARRIVLRSHELGIIGKLATADGIAEPTGSLEGGRSLEVVPERVRSSRSAACLNLMTSHHGQLDQRSFGSAVQAPVQGATTR